MAIAIFTGYFTELWMVLFIVVIHELGHSFAAQYFSWRVRKISFLPFGGVAEMDEHGNRPLKEEFIVILAGPLQHVWMAIAALLLERFGFFPGIQYDVFLQYNWMILLFNLLPIWPLDGGKLLMLVLCRNHTFLHALKWSILSSLILLSSISLLTILISPTHLHLWFVMLYLYVSLWKEWKQRHFVFMRFLLERYYGKKSAVVQLVPLHVSVDSTLPVILEQFQRGVKHPIIVFQNGEEKGQLDENEVLHAFFTEKQTTAKINDLLYLY